MARRRKRRARKSHLPRGAYRVPNGYHVVTSWHRGADGKRYRVRNLRPDHPDLKALADVFIRLGRKEV